MTRQLDRSNAAFCSENGPVPSHPHLTGRAAASLLPDLASSRRPRYLTLADSLAELILDGRVAPGTRLPSERELAVHLRISRATVTASYDLLRAQRYLASRSGSGSVVTLPSGARLHAGSSRWAAAAGQARQPLLDLTSATLPAPAEELAEAVRMAAEQLPDIATSDGYELVGLPALRAAIAARFTERGLPTSAEQIFVTNGALHGMDLLLRLLTGPGDRVLTELPTYSGLLDAVRSYPVRSVPVPVAAGGGWDVAAMSAALRQSAPTLAVLIPDFHNPTGALVPAEARAQVIGAAHRAGTTVVIDESFVELGLTAEPPAPTATLGRSVITVGSMSKPFWGGLRIGWIRGPAELITRLATVRAAIDMGGAVLDQLVAAHILPQLAALAARRRAVLRPRRDTLLAALAEQLPEWHSTTPAGGLSLWVELDAPLATPLAGTAPAHGVRIVPGSRFGVDGTLERFLRLPYTQPEPVLRAAVSSLAAAWRALDPATSAAAPLVVA